MANPIKENKLPFPPIVLLILFGTIFYSVTFLLKKRISFIANKRKKFAKGIHKRVDETLNNFKYTKLIGSEDIKIAQFDKNSYGLYRVNTVFSLLNIRPKLW